MKPSAAMAAKAPMMVTGTVVAGTSMARQSCRKTKMTISTKHAGFDERDVNLLDRGLHEDGRIERDRYRRGPAGKSLRAGPSWRAPRSPRERVGVGQQENADAADGRSLKVKVLAVGLGAELHPADILDARDLPASPLSTLTTMFSKSAASLKRPATLTVYWKFCPFGAGGMPIGAGGRPPGSAAGSRSIDVARRQAEGLQLVRVHPDAHGILAGAEDRDVAHARQPRELVLQIDDAVVRQEQAVVAACPARSA